MIGRCGTLAVAATFVALAMTSGIAPAFGGQADNSVRMAFTNVLPNLDPYLNTLAVGSFVADNVWNTLIRRNPTTLALEPDLATSWHWIDERTLELSLREGVRFHNGEPFGADDVVATLRFAADPNNKISRPEVAAWIERVEKIDEHTVRIRAKTVYAPAVAMLATTFAVIHPDSYYAGSGPRGGNPPSIGTGPFRVAQHTLGKSITLERNRDYFSGGSKVAPGIERVEIRFIPDPTTQVAEIVARRLDLIMNVTRDQAEQLRAIPDLQVLAGDAAVFWYLQLNTLETTPAPPLRNLLVRRAIAHAIDRETIMRALQGPASRIIHTECHPSQFGCSDADAPRYEYDPAKARALLTGAGYSDGFDLVLHAPNPRNNIAEAIANYLEAVGIRTRLQFMENSALVTAQTNGRVAMALHRLTVGLAEVSRNPLQLNHFLTNRDVNRDPEVRGWIVRGDSVFGEAERRDAYGKAFALIAERAYVLPLSTDAHYFVAASDLMFTPYVDTFPRFYEMHYR